MNEALYSYSEGLIFPVTFISREVKVGDVIIGGQQAIRLQSMTNTNTLDTRATVKQTLELYETGSELVRITTPTLREAENLNEIRKELHKMGCRVPLVADVHFQPKVAEAAARIVEKVRINPGNYADHKLKPKYSEKEYLEELEKIQQRILPLLKICKEEGTAIRIGTNHGSLSERIMNRYGDTPAGMVESAMEFARICCDFGFYDVVLSMKSSNIKVMVQATRLLVAKMLKEGMDFPLHLGVTEAGSELEGRVKSAIGIGALLEDGIGDTIRVSLTEDPVKEIPFAKKLAEPYQALRKSEVDKRPPLEHPFSYSRRSTNEISGIGGDQPAQVVDADMEPEEIENSEITVLEAGNFHSTNYFREKFRKLPAKLPCIIKRDYEIGDPENFTIRASVDLGGLLIDGLGDGVWVNAPQQNHFHVNDTVFAILQASGARITKTEFIACPSCGRTKFDIEKILKEVKTRLSQHAGLKIAVMGCIVNGPGEMADADYGYVGSGPGKVSLYRKQQLVLKNIPEEEALEALIGLIEENRGAII